MVGLPSVENREGILRTLLSKEKVEEGLDFKELATMTEGFSGSDLKVSLYFVSFFIYKIKSHVSLTKCLSIRTCV